MSSPSPSTASSSVLRITGEDDYVVHSLRNALVSHFGSLPASNVDKMNIPPNANDTELPSIRINNRYFMANIWLENVVPPTQSETNAGSEPVTTRQEDGIVLVFDARETTGRTGMSRAAKFESLSYYHEYAESNGQCGDLLRLCVGVTNLSSSSDSENAVTSTSQASSSEKQREEEFSRRVLWCLDRGYEYVEVDLSEAGVTTGHDERDKDGFARVVEAVSSTVWSSSVMHQEKASQLQSTYTEDTKEFGAATESAVKVADERSTEESNGGEKDSADRDEKCNGENEPSTTSDELNIATATTGSSDVDVEGDDATNSLLASHGEAAMEALLAGSKEETVDDGKEEAMFRNLEGLMNEAARIRDGSKRGEFATDEERRQLAGETAMRLMGLLDSFGYDDDDEGDHSSDDDDDGK